MSELLAIPFKRSLQIDLNSELSKLIDFTTYQTSSFFQNDLQLISNNRNLILNPDLSIESLNLLKTYYQQICQLERKFPSNQIEFSWFQTLSLKSTGSSYKSFQWEKLNILYNIGALYSFLAIDTTATTGDDESLKLKCNYFQSSATVFDYLFSLHESNPTTEEYKLMDKHTIHALKYLMLAQAQECFWFKATLSNNYKDSLISRLSSQIVVYYKSALKWSKLSSLIRKDWCDHIESKIHYFNAVTLYRRALTFGSEKEYGSMIRALLSSQSEIKSCKLDSRASFQRKIEQELKDMERDNDFIHLQLVPDTIPTTIKPADMVKVFPIEEVIPMAPSTTTTTLFNDLIPITVMESSEAYNERQNTYIIENVINPLLALNKILKDSVKTKLTDIDTPIGLKNVSHEELFEIESSFTDLETNNPSIESYLTNIRQLLQSESHLDDQYRSKHGTLHWTLPESKVVNSSFFEKLDILQKYLNDAKLTDKNNRELFGTIDVNLLTSPIKLPPSNNPILIRAQQLINERESRITEIKLKSDNHKVLPKIISEYKKNGEHNLESVFMDHLKYFHDDLKFVQEEKRRNSELIQDIEDENEKKNEKESQSQTRMERLDPRKLYIEDLQHSSNLLNELKQNIIEGAKFYVDLAKSTNQLLHATQQFVSNRKEEAEALDNKLMTV
ncbi:Rim20p NDAI_0E00890 [Naumovozyma dairenensis CBS 421]|uniref:BRO1 domain-containing protein n=1 Tax=Naumovozyma dairenensis (strain ATCC 10597 / BCRC 20456 / CBS 421 / NBRC 0211 / NRRL Y-12639) TaxID=1071378 RepID=G0WAY5_NAUDC|nr:hypothetical protein NDAI_0E00890 [Naumovozyma dairenensis CBS 421]CCD24905.1 hypothetical protein NDAI_0E00890 [Naumovozyma dairenensis CBS 421]